MRDIRVESWNEPQDAPFVEPPSMDDRIVNQLALFSVISDPTVALDDWLAGQPQLYRRVIIPARLKWEICDKLDQSNIAERVLFPGLEGLTARLKRHSSPRAQCAGSAGIGPPDP